MGPLRAAMTLCAAAGISASLSVVALATQAQPNLKLGAYEIRDLDSGSINRMCLKKQRQLVQIGNEEASCDHRLVDSAAQRRTVRYNCTGSDWGRTSIRVENAKLARVESQGIRNGAPFKMRAELRYAGEC